MPGFWATRMRRGLWTKNYHWRAAVFARVANFLLGRGHRTNAEIARDKALLSYASRPSFRPEKLQKGGGVKPVTLSTQGNPSFRPSKLRMPKL